MRQWTLEERQRQARLIKQWKPWKQSTGAKTAEGKAISARNAYKGNVRGSLRELNTLLREQKAKLESLV